MRCIAARVLVRGRPGVGITAALLACATLALVPAGRAGASLLPVPPDRDAFYTVPANVASYPNGAVLESRHVTATMLSVPLAATAWQVKYKTLDNQDHPTATVTTVLVPSSPWRGSGPRPLLSYQVAEDGVGTRCAVSYALTAGLPAADSNAAQESVAIALALARGWTVVASDYEGPQSLFLGDRAEAHGVLDGIRAARAFTPAGVAANAPIGMIGYSGGSVATVWADSLQRSYAPELRIAGIALGGAAADLRATIRAFDATPASGAMIVVWAALNRGYPDVHILSYLNARGRHDVAAARSECLDDAALRFPNLKTAQIEAQPDILDNPALTAFFHRIQPLGFPLTPAAPVYDYHAVGDEFAPIAADRQLIGRYCAAGVRVQHVETPLGEHLTELPLGITGALNYLRDRFSGLPAPSSCASSRP